MYRLKLNNFEMRQQVFKGFCFLTSLNKLQDFWQCCKQQEHPWNRVRTAEEELCQVPMEGESLIPLIIFVPLIQNKDFNFVEQ